MRLNTFNRSIQPTVMALLDPKGAETLRQNREKLSSNITELINEYGPKVFPDFDGKYIYLFTYNNNMIMINNKHDASQLYFKNDCAIHTQSCAQSYNKHKQYILDISTQQITQDCQWILPTSNSHELAGR